jgi:hypothetical protein
MELLETIFLIIIITVPLICYRLTGARSYHDFHRDDGKPSVVDDHIKMWFYKGEPHREDGPAFEYTSGTKEWYLNGKLVYSDKINRLHKYPILSKEFKQSIIKYKLKSM